MHLPLCPLHCTILLTLTLLLQSLQPYMQAYLLQLVSMGLPYVSVGLPVSEPTVHVSRGCFAVASANVMLVTPVGRGLGLGQQNCFYLVPKHLLL